MFIIGQPLASQLSNVIDKMQRAEKELRRKSPRQNALAVDRKVINNQAESDVRSTSPKPLLDVLPLD
jgi:hypothetical protein